MSTDPITQHQLDGIDSFLNGPLGTAAVIDRGTALRLVAEVQRLRAVPPPADRAALLRAAALIEERADDLWAPGTKANQEMRADAAELRRMADEAQQPETQTAVARAAEWASKQRAATVDPAVCPRCKGDNREAFELCDRCATEQPECRASRSGDCLREAEGFAWDTDMLEPDEYGEVADAVLAVLPPPADRAAVMREAAELGRALSRQGYSAQEIAKKLDRLADEAQQPAPDPRR